jgi:hypothetical protein
MSEFKGHTPGPWVIVDAADGAVESIRVEEWKRNNLMGDFRGSIICDLSASHGGRPHAYKEAEANARLIAAAPELLAENQRLREALERYADPMNWGYYDESGCAKGIGRFEDACFIGPLIARTALQDAALNELTEQAQKDGFYA